MCGRYAATSRPEDLVEEFDIEQVMTGEPSRSLLSAPQDPPPGAPDYNVAPTKQAPVILTRAPRPTDPSSEEDAPPVRQLRLLTWGLVPSWAKDVKVGLRMINARAESVLEKSAFAKAAASRRALVPASGWYEWQVRPSATDARRKPRKQPFFIHHADGSPLAMAALYEFWRDRSVQDNDDPAAGLPAYTIIPTVAEPGLDRIHDRQPLVLEREDWADWLDLRRTDPATVHAPPPFSRPRRLRAPPISSAVNSSRNNGPRLLEPVGRDDLDGVVDPMTGEV